MVRYADGPRAEVTTDIKAPTAKVWSLVTDINLPSQFSDEFVRAEWLDEGPVLGARFEGHNQNEFIGEWSVLCTVTDCTQDRAFEWTVGEPAHKVARWRFDLADHEGGVRLVFSAEMGPGPSGLTPLIEQNPDREEALVGHRLASWTANMQRTIDGIRDLAEQDNP